MAVASVWGLSGDGILVHVSSFQVHTLSHIMDDKKDNLKILFIVIISTGKGIPFSITFPKKVSNKLRDMADSKTKWK